MFLSRKLVQWLCRSCIIISSTVSLCAFATPSLPLQAGAAKVEITPQDLTGFVSVWAKPFKGIHDPIYARTLVLKNGSTSAAIVATDLVEFGDSLPFRLTIF